MFNIIGVQMLYCNYISNKNTDINEDFFEFLVYMLFSQKVIGKDCKIGICCFSAKHIALRSKSKDKAGSELGYCVWLWTVVCQKTLVKMFKNIISSYQFIKAFQNDHVFFFFLELFNI
jgi:hypothetical protein